MRWSTIFEKKAFSIKKYGELYKFTVYSLGNRTKKIIPSEIDNSPPWEGNYLEKEYVNEFKLDNNIGRAKSMIYEYALSNDWEYFVTLTIDPKKYDRYNLSAWYSDLSKWINNYNTRNGLKIKYLFVPELHCDGAWHIHGFIMGLPSSELCSFVSGVHPQDLIDNGYLNWPAYEKKFGYCSFALIGQKEAAGAYILKYVNKSIGEDIKDLGGHLYYCSKGLKKADVLVRGDISVFQLLDFNFAYENDYVKTSTFSYDDLQRYPFL